MLDGSAGVAAGVGGLAGIAGDLHDGGLQFSQGIANLCRVTGLALGTTVQTTAQVGQGAAAAGHLFGVAADSPDQVDQIVAQAVQRHFNVVHLAIGGAKVNRLAEVAVGPMRKRRRQVGQHTGEAPLQGVDQQGNQQDQANHRALDHSYFTLDTSVLAAHLRL
ncbi:hypothetical protein D3C85_902910 [compost metagenome]